MRGINSASKHWVTISALPSGYTLENTYKIISLSASVSNTGLLYECTADKYATNFISRNSSCEGQTLIKTLGYVYKNLETNTAMLYRCYKSGGDHFVSSNTSCTPSSLEGPLGYYILS